MTNKKNEDADYDIEAAVLTGAGLHALGHLPPSDSLCRSCAASPGRARQPAACEETLLCWRCCGRFDWGCASMPHPPHSCAVAAPPAGGGHAFKPLVGVVRSLPGPLSHAAVLVKAAHQLDRVAVLMDTRPQLRMAVLLYFALLHAALLLL
jgi:hypothetical protein